MAAAFIHYFLGIGVAYACGYSGIEALMIGLLGAIQDADAVSFLGYRQIARCKKSELLMHRGITHTILFAVVIPGIVALFHPLLAFILLINFFLHIFTDYVTSWGVAPFQPFSSRRYSLGLMTIYDIPLTGLSLVVAVSGFLFGSVMWAFALFFGYCLVRYVLKLQLPHRDLLEPVGHMTYTYCIQNDTYTVGKVDILGREKKISIPLTDQAVDSTMRESIESKIEGTMLSHILEYPVYSRNGSIITVYDARHVLFPKSSRFGIEIFYDEKSETLYSEIAGRKIRL